MYIILLKFAGNRSRASEFMEGHNSWIKRGFDDGVFLCVGSIKPSEGGAIIAHGETLADLEKRLLDDPFVAENVVNAEISEIAPARTDDRLAFLLA